MAQRSFFKVYGRFSPVTDRSEHKGGVAGHFHFYSNEPSDAAAADADHPINVDWIPHSNEGIDPDIETWELSEIDPESDGGKKKLKAIYGLKPFSLSMGKAGGLDFTFRGAAIIDQIRRTAAGPELDLRWMLASASAYGDGQVFSEVNIGQKSRFNRADFGKKEATFGFQLCLPTPGAQGVVDEKPVEIFPFRVRYSANYEELPVDGLPVAELAAGAEGADSKCEWFDIRAARGIDSTILGHFGFSRQDGGRKYYHFPRAGQDNTDAISAALWLNNVDVFCDHKLANFADLPDGIKGRMRLENSSEIDDADTIVGEAFESIWPEFQNGKARIFFRSAFTGRVTSSFNSNQKPKDISSGDVWVGSGHWTKQERRPGRPQGKLKPHFERKNYYFSNSQLLSPFHPDGAEGLLDNLRMKRNQKKPPSQLERWTKFDLITAYKLNEDDVIRAAYRDDDNKRAVSGEIEVRFLYHWSETSASVQASLERSKISGRGTIANILTQGLSSQRMPRLGLSSLEPQEASNAFPDARISAGANQRFAVGGEIPFALERNKDRISSLSWKVKARKRKKWPKIDLGLSVWEVNPGRGLGEESTSIYLNFSLPGIDQGGDSRFVAQLLPIEKLSGAGEGGVGFLLRAPEETSTVPLRKGDNSFFGRLNGLDFHAKNPTIGKGDAGHWHFKMGILKEEIESRKKARHFLAYDNDFEITIGVASVEPVGTNSGRGERDRTTRPILLPLDRDQLGGSGDQKSSNFEITLREQITRSKDRVLTAKIQDIRTAGADARHYVMISEQPFALAAFAMEPLEERGGADNNLVAQYSSEDRKWVFRSAGNRFHYRLPPQGVGESMDKPRQLEITDRIIDGESEDDGPEPYVRKGKTKTSALARRVVDYRLTSPADIWIEPSDLKRNYVAPEWEMYELFRQSGDFGVGSKLSGLRAEFIYGLVSSIDPAQENGEARNTRIAEIEVLLGRPPSPEDDPDKNDDRTKKWNGIRDAIAHRPERLELWMPGAGGQSHFLPAHFTDSARFSLRDDAQLRSPFPATDSGSDETEKSLGDRLTRHGLAGGPVWGLEARAFVKRFLDEPESTGGSIEKIALSPHGGDADFRAEFLNGLLAVIAEVRGGRVQRQRVEIIGRVGVFWHRAKHVVIYERTVNLSPQFTPDGGISARSRRPIIRKVEEFVELLEPERNFPDTDIGVSNGPGFLKSVCFNSKRIHVDSAWSEDVGVSGWKIPLWNRLSAKERPSVYPHPDIAFISHCEGEETNPVVAQECLDPDNLYFYSDAAAEDAQTDLWDPVLAVDWVNLPAPSHVQQKNLDGSGARAHPRKPSAQRIPRGQRKFTWRLSPADRRVQINFGRPGNPIYTRLETLTFSRAVTNKGSDFSTLVSAAMEQAGSLNETDPLGDVKPKLAKFLRAIKTRDIDKARTAAKILSGSINEAILSNPFDGEQTKQFQELAKAAQKSPDQCAKMVDDFAGGVERKRMLVMANLREWQGGAKPKDLRTIANETRKEWIERVVKEIAKAVNPTFADASSDIGNARCDVERARAMATDFIAEARSLIVRSLADLQAAHAAYDDGKPWSPARIADYQQQLENARAGLVADLETELNETRLRLATEIGGVATLVGSAATAALESVTMGPRGLIARIGRAENAAQAVLRDQLDRFTQGVAPVQDAVEDVIKKLSKVGDSEPKIEEILDNLRSVQIGLDLAVEEMAARIETLERQILTGRHDLSSVSAQGQQLFSRVRKEIKSTIDGAKNELLEILKLDPAPNDALKTAVEKSNGEIDVLWKGLKDRLKSIGEWASKGEKHFERLERLLKASVEGLDEDMSGVSKAIETEVDVIDGALLDLNKLVTPAKIAGYIGDGIVRPVFEGLISESTFSEIKADANQIPRVLDDAIDEIGGKLEKFSAEARKELVGLNDEARKVCNALKAGVQAIENKLKAEAKAIEGKLKKELAQEFSADRIADVLKNSQELKKYLDGVDKDFKEIDAGFRKSKVDWDSYADRVFHEVGRLDNGGLAAAPNRILQLYAAAASAPELPNLDYARKRLGYYYDGINSVIDTTPAEAYFSKMGSELKALGLSIPFDRLEKRLLPSDLSGLDIGKVLRKFSGIDLSGLFKGNKMPKGAKDVIRLTHEFDAKQFRAWVQIDINLPMKGRKTLFSVGPFKMDFVDSHLHATVRLESSKDSDKVRETGHASLVTTVDSVVSGQSMVQLEKLALNFDQKGKLEVELDPKNIKLNPAFKFIQEALSSIFPDDVGGLKLVKKNGLPIGVEHEFVIPPISIMAGTSGVSNLAISNRFSLLAFPDFVIANSFALCRPEAPFLFTIFVIGGAGYITIDAEYRPFNGDLAITVEAAAGGSAAFGFSLGPINGMVFFSLSIALSYRKLIGRSGGGLSISIVLVISGKVDVAGLATVYLVLSLRMNYRNSGQIDGLGSISITISVTRFWDYKYRKNVKKVLQKGKSSKGQRKISHNKASPNLAANSKAKAIMEARATL